jgi:peptidoglycan/LPS O-acetylase OafA/YrhL
MADNALERSQHDDGRARTTPAGQRGAGRMAALDGLRGLALVGMLAWHAQLDWVKGGFARMTIFFVLSGFLGAMSLLRIRRRDPDHPTSTYLRRRARRLLPLTLIGVAAAIAVTGAVGSVAARRSLQGDVVSVLTSVSNWRFIIDVRPYGAMFESPSSLQHLWSLSAEEQCIWLLPIVLAAVLWVTRRHSWAVMGAVAAGLLSIPIVVSQSPDTIYYGTPNRAGEFLAGAALALWLDRSNAAGTATFGRSSAVGLVRAAGAASLATLLLVMLLVDRETRWLYHGGLALVVLPVLGVILAITTGGGAATRVLSVGPLTTLGRWALSIYVLHWPLYLLMGDGRVPLHGSALALTEMTAAIALGGVFHIFVERPLMPGPSTSPSSSAPVPASIAPSSIAPVSMAPVSMAPTSMGPRPAFAREAATSPAPRRWSGDRVFLPAMGAIAVVLVAAAVMLPTPAPVYDFAGAQARIDQGSTPRPTDPTDPTDATEPADGDLLAQAGASRSVNIGVYGGSTGVLLGAAMFDFTDNAPGLQAVPAWSHYGCGFLTAGQRLARSVDGTLARNRPDPECDGWEQGWLDATQEHQVQVALVVTGVWETTDWYLDGGTGPTAIGDPEFDDLLRADISRAFDELAGLGTRVIVATAPNIGPGSTGHARADRGLPDDHPRRVEAYNQLLQDVAAARDDVVLIDYGAYIDSFDPDQSASWMPDGIHPTEAAARQIWDSYLGPAISDAIAITWPDLATGTDLVATTSA